MGLILKRDRHGKMRPWWYGEYKSDKRRNVVNLGVKVTGRPPETLKVADIGDLKRVFHRQTEGVDRTHNGRYCAALLFQAEGDGLHAGADDGSPQSTHGRNATDGHRLSRSGLTR